MTSRTHAQQVFTVPNLLSVLRIILIPWILVAYLDGAVMKCAFLIVISGLTDLADGWIARHWGAVSNVGKVLDPVADKLTLAALLAMLLSEHRLMLLPLAVLVIRETLMACTGIASVLCTREVRSARWHGKVTTLLLYATAFVHILWQEMPLPVSNSMIVICTLAQLISLVMYAVENVSCIRRAKGGI
ncbi:MAG: CDP-alcohol phosphatidyltransferase family protein [Clostridia bacterium]|nr:CDP-alcohol phosphatidyltransferase family protein [Clostridia bacterium]